MQNLPNACSICSPNYREQALAIPNFLRPYRERFDVQQEDIIFGDKGTHIYAEIGPASALFKNRFRFEPQYLELSLTTSSDRLMLELEARTDALRGKATKIPEVRRLLPSPPTIKIFNLNLPSIEQTVIDTDRKSVV